MNETHLTEEIADSEVKLNGYKIFRTDSKSRHTGGTCIYVKDILKTNNIKRMVWDGIWITSIEIKINNTDVTIVSVYCSPSENKSEMVDNINHWLEDSCENKSVIICGDFNIDLLSDNNITRKIKNTFNDNGLKQLITVPTRIFNQTSTLIDLCVTNIDSLKTKVTNDDQISDHKIIELNCKLNSNHERNEMKQIKIWNNYSSVNLQNEIRKWSRLWNMVSDSDINTKMNWLNTNLKKSVNKFIKVKNFKQKNNWYDTELEAMRKKKNILYKVAQHTGNDAKWMEYRQYKNEYKNKIEIKQYQSIQNQLNKVQNDTKGTWKVLKSIYSDGRNEIDCIEVNNQKIEDKNEIANELNKFFVDSIDDICRKIPFELFDFQFDTQIETEFSLNEINF